MFEWDEKKNRSCKEERGFDFSIVHDFDFATAVIFADDRKDYGEIRYKAYNMIAGVLYNVVFTLRGQNLRIISIRRVHEKEGKRYGF
ncbi:hypothetical protein MNBD_ALPHA02-953 [hydrothermal vent metagenome]|uniref:BrnT family toxin n=1 Tax=hydrothermal vent metagenome TaxID=652676 RepID=A0A3B0R6A1_9ZZZZ